jgi:glycolate oxidase subunit GlcD
MRSELGAIVGDDHVVEPTATYLQDASVASGVRGCAEAVVLPGTAEEVAAVVKYCYEQGIPVVPRGGGTGFSGGAVPLDEGAVVLSLERLRRVRSLDPLLWRMEVEAGLPTGDVHRLARENGLYFPPDPGASESSFIGGNVATNAGGPHTFKYGVTGHWVTGLEAVVAPGRLVQLGGPVRKDVAGYDLRSLLIGSEGTLGVITSIWLRLIPAPEAAVPVVATYASAAEGADAMQAVLASGVVPAAIEYLDGATLRAGASGFPGDSTAGFALVVEVDGTAAEVAAALPEIREALGDDVVVPDDVRAFWSWRGGVSHAVTAQRGGKLSEDVAVPLDRLAEAVEETLAIGAKHGLEACSWGHAGDGNLHSTFMLTPGDAAEAERAQAAAEDLFAMAVRLGGTVSGEHGLGILKNGQLSRQWDPAAIELHRAVKRALDPKNLLNPGKKLP